MYATNMFGNSSSISEDALAFPCKLSIFITNGYNVLKILLQLPLSSYVIHLGYQRWQQHQRSFKTVSHSDLFTYHLAAMELIGLLGCFLFLGGVNTENSMILTVGMCISYIVFYGELFFSILTCVERYLAVVHPIIYHGLKSARGIRIRNISIGCIWLFCIVMTTIKMSVPPKYEFVIRFCIVIFSILVISSSSITALCVLLRLGPGERGRKKEGVDQSRWKAFYTIIMVSSVVWLWFVVILVDGALGHSTPMRKSNKCLIMVSVGWLNLPCSLASPLLFLYKERKLFCCRKQ